MLEVKMKKEELLKGVSQTQSIAEKRSSMPILSNVLLEVIDGRVAITATDLEISFRGTYEAEVIGDGRLTVPARKLYEIVRGMADEDLVLKETDNYGLTLSGSRSNFQLHGLSPEDFPPMPDYEEVTYVEADADLILDMVEKTIYSVSVEETRYNLAGVFMEKSDVEGRKVLRMVSTDGHRLSLIEKEIPESGSLNLDKGVIISRKGVTEFRKLAEEGGTLKLGFSSNSAVVRRDNTVMVMRLLEGRFPDYNLVIPKKNTKVMKVGRKDFMEMLRRVSIMGAGVVFSISPKELKLTAVNPELGEAHETMPVEYEDEQMEIGFNPRYFIEAASALNSDLLTISFDQPGNPCVLTAEEDSGFIGVIMPVKI